MQWKEQSSCVTLNKSFNLSAPQTVKVESAYHRRLSDPEREDASVSAIRRWFTAPYHFIVHHSELSDRAPAIGPSGVPCALSWDDNHERDRQMPGGFPPPRFPPSLRIVVLAADI